MTEPAEREDVVRWGVATGRYSPARAQFWADAVAEERRRTGSAAQTEAAIRSLHPVYNTAEPAPGGLSDTPLLDELDRQVFGPSIEERHRAEDLAAEAALAEEIERERQETPGQLTAAEERAIFGDTEPD